jgi:hypothetical protein
LEAKKWGPRPHQIVDLMEARGLPASRAQDVDKARALYEAMFGDL